MPQKPVFYGEFLRMQREMESLLDFFFGTKKPPAVMGEVAWRPATDVYETAKAFVVRSEVAGIRPEDVEITVVENTIRIRGVRAEAGGSGKQTYHQMEINYGVFERMISLPQKINSRGVKASYRDGFLEVLISKEQEDEEGIVIEVEKER